ncbi:hypothetical protein CDAR_622281 [Caerostris darwini]|uniref:Uncharacterized protein n=1 Tax=Caerostris darwini TaxID=1538125 RepID=A0AAV4QEQ0_9ARAC|nr:hypothetical protein CDAR_622281 [Caerostris darwini]
MQAIKAVRFTLKRVRAKQYLGPTSGVGRRLTGMVSSLVIQQRTVRVSDGSHLEKTKALGIRRKRVVEGDDGEVIFQMDYFNSFGFALLSSPMT